MYRVDFSSVFWLPAQALFASFSAGPGDLGPHLLYLLATHPSWFYRRVEVFCTFPPPFFDLI